MLGMQEAVLGFKVSAPCVAWSSFDIAPTSFQDRCAAVRWDGRRYSYIESPSLQVSQANLDRRLVTVL